MVGGIGELAIAGSSVLYFSLSRLTLRSDVPIALSQMILRYGIDESPKAMTHDALVILYWLLALGLSSF